MMRIKQVVSWTILLVWSPPYHPRETIRRYAPFFAVVAQRPAACSSEPTKTAAQFHMHLCLYVVEYSACNHSGNITARRRRTRGRLLIVFGRENLIKILATFCIKCFAHTILPPPPLLNRPYTASAGGRLRTDLTADKQKMVAHLFPIYHFCWS